MNIVQTGGGGGSGDRMKCPNPLKCWAEEKMPQIKRIYWQMKRKYWPLWSTILGFKHPIWWHYYYRNHSNYWGFCLVSLKPFEMISIFQNLFRSTILWKDLVACTCWQSSVKSNKPLVHSTFLAKLDTGAFWDKFDFRFIKLIKDVQTFGGVGGTFFWKPSLMTGLLSTMTRYTQYEAFCYKFCHKALINIC